MAGFVIYDATGYRISALSYNQRLGQRKVWADLLKERARIEQEQIEMERWNIGGERRVMIIMLLIGFLFGVVTLSVILVVRHLISGS